MKYLMILLTVCSGLAFSQTPAPKPPKPPAEMDSEMASLMAKVEGAPRELKVEVKYEPKSDLEKVVVKEAETFVRALVEEDYKVSYTMMCNAYRKVVTLPKYMAKKRLTLSKASITNIIVKGENCAELRGYLHGSESDSVIGAMKIPFREFLFIEDDQWRVFRNPYETSMGIMHPAGRKIKNPCR